jgi:hypothetical protein
VIVHRINRKKIIEGDAGISEMDFPQALFDEFFLVDRGERADQDPEGPEIELVV